MGKKKVKRKASDIRSDRPAGRLTKKQQAKKKARARNFITSTRG